MEFVSEGCAALTGWSSAAVMRQQPAFQRDGHRRGTPGCPRCGRGRNCPARTVRAEATASRAPTAGSDGSGSAAAAACSILADSCCPLEGSYLSRMSRRRRRRKARCGRARSGYRNLFIPVPRSPSYQTTPDGQILVANPALVQMLAMRRWTSCARGTSRRAAFQPGSPRRAFQGRDQDLATFVGFEATWTTKDGGDVHVPRERPPDPILRRKDPLLRRRRRGRDGGAECPARAAAQAKAQTATYSRVPATRSWCFEPEGETILDANPKACDLYGYARGELVGGSFKRLTLDVARGERTIADLVRTSRLRTSRRIHVAPRRHPVTLQISASFRGLPGSPRNSQQRSRHHASEGERETNASDSLPPSSSQQKVVLITDRGGVILYVKPGVRVDHRVSGPTRSSA